MIAEQLVGFEVPKELKQRFQHKERE